MNVILLGPPGAGKGTQANRLRAVLGLPYIASGDIFRALGREDTTVAREVRRYMDRGEYVPDDLTNELILARVDQNDAKRGFLLDGYPRTVPQAEALERALQAEGRKVEVVLYITAPTEMLVKRITGRLVCPNCHAIYNLDTKLPRHDMICDVCGHVVQRRSDESPEVVRTRLETYIRQTEPVVRFYRKQSRLREIDGSRSPREVEREVDAAVSVGEARETMTQPGEV